MSKVTMYLKDKMEVEEFKELVKEARKKREALQETKVSFGKRTRDGYPVTLSGGAVKEFFEGTWEEVPSQFSSTTKVEIER